MFYHIDDEGTLYYRCHHEACVHHHGHEEHAPLTAHVSHEAIRFVDKETVALPACPDCEAGSQTFVRVVFSEKELAPPIIKRDSLGQIVEAQITPGWYAERDALGRIVDILPRPEVARHLELARHLKDIGKVPPENHIR